MSHFNLCVQKQQFSNIATYSCTHGQLAKVDIVTRKHIEWVDEEGYPSEPVFVASPNAIEEDDGKNLSIL